MAPPEALGDNLRGRGDGHIVHHGAHAALAQLRGEDLGGVFRIAVDRGIGNHHALFLRRVRAPEVVLFEKVLNIAAPDEAVQRAEHPDVQIGDLPEKILHLHAVFANDVCIVPPRLFEIIAVKIHLVGEDRAVERAENTEGVRGEERVRGFVVGHHDLRPVNHRSHIERKLVRARGERVALLDELHAPCGAGAEKLRDHHGRFVVAYDRRFRVAQQQLRKRGGVVRLHVVHDQII